VRIHHNRSRDAGERDGSGAGRQRSYHPREPGGDGRPRLGNHGSRRGTFAVLDPGRIEIGIAAVWLAINAASLDSWFAELVRRIMFIGLFAFILDQGPTVSPRRSSTACSRSAPSGGSASPADVFNAGIRVASKMSEQAQFGLFEDNALAIAAVFAMVVVVVCFSLVAAIFVAVMVEMYVGLLAGMIMLGLGGSSYTKDFAVRYLVYAFSVGMKLMALVMIARIGSEVLIGLAEAPTATTDQFITTLAIAGISVVVFIIAMYVPPIIQGVVQGASVTGGMEAIRHGGQAATFRGRRALSWRGGAGRGGSATAARAAGSSFAGAALRGMASGIGQRRPQPLGRQGQGDRVTGSLCQLAAWPSQRQARPDARGRSSRPKPPPPLPTKHQRTIQDMAKNTAPENPISPHGRNGTSATAPT
jgi:type IV secretion system protein TrbL